ncbi:glycosyltransferase [Intrasporangium sp. YIM S08009]|uniref:glycosyltransferase n=1 Tax=Intrasporangium zincisolvens TaxID=3080018 RepID=UPI002B060DFE|nr:glycosyltransferase [Intrasporangium sp. YIM S08009]
MRILSLAPGTRGDVAPAAGLGEAFTIDGHEVTIVAGAEHASLVTEVGCAHVPIDASMTPPGDESGVRAYLDVLRRYMDAAATSALAALDPDRPFDVVLTNAISPYGHDIAEHLGVPSAAALLQPAEPSAAYPPMIASARDLGRLGNRLAGRLAERVRTPYDPACARVRSELGLPPESRVAAQRRRRREGMPVHHGMSPAVLPRPDDWSERLALDGFWWYPTPADWQPPADLAAFLDAGPAPVVVTLGSLPPGTATAAQVEAAFRPGRHRVVLLGDALAGVAERLTAGLGTDRVAHAGDVPHEWLLPRAAAVVHQAGAGVTSAALRAGVASVPVPMHTDQPFWARRLRALSAATDPVPMKRLTSEALSARVDEATSSTALRDGAARVARALADEDGSAPLRHWLRELDGAAQRHR